MEGLGTKRKDKLIEKKVAKSGWCLDGLHKRCEKYYYGRWKEHDCNCSCHKEKETK